MHDQCDDLCYGLLTWLASVSRPALRQSTSFAYYGMRLIGDTALSMSTERIYAVKLPGNVVQAVRKHGLADGCSFVPAWGSPVTVCGINLFPSKFPKGNWSGIINQINMSPDVSGCCRQVIPAVHLQATVHNPFFCSHAWHRSRHWIGGKHWIDTEAFPSSSRIDVAYSACAYWTLDQTFSTVELINAFLGS